MLAYTFPRLLGLGPLITCHLVSTELANCGFFVNITQWKSKILPHLQLQWKRRGFKFCWWVSIVVRVAEPLSGIGRSVRCMRKVWVGQQEWGSVRTCGQWMNGSGRKSESNSSSSDSSKVYNTVCSLAVNKGDSSRYNKVPWYYFPTSLRKGVHQQ